MSWATSVLFVVAGLLLLGRAAIVFAAPLADGEAVDAEELGGRDFG